MSKDLSITKQADDIIDLTKQYHNLLQRDEELEEIISLAERLHASGYSNEEKIDKEDSWDM